MSGSASWRVSESELLDAVAELEPAGTSDIGESVGMTRQGADFRLRRLEEQGKVRSKKVGPTLVWMVSDSL